MHGFGSLVKTLGNKLTSATWPLLGEILPPDVAKDGPKTSAVIMVYTDQSWEYFDKNLRWVTTVTHTHTHIYIFFALNLLFFSLSLFWSSTEEAFHEHLQLDHLNTSFKCSPLIFHSSLWVTKSHSWGKVIAICSSVWWNLKISLY